MTTPVRPEDLFHTGVVVDDLAGAKDELGDQLGLTWFEGGGEVTLRSGDDVTTVSAAYAISREGPHHVELCQSVEGTLWTATPPGHAHHLGYWATDVAEVSAALSARGMPLVASIAAGVDAPPMCAYHQSANGLYVEVVAAGMRRVLFPARGSED